MPSADEGEFQLRTITYNYRSLAQRADVGAGKNTGGHRSGAGVGVYPRECELRRTGFIQLTDTACAADYSRKMQVVRAVSKHIEIGSRRDIDRIRHSGTR